MTFDWVARGSAAFAYVSAVGASLWMFATPGGADPPLTGALVLGWLAIGLLWVKVAALWARQWEWSRGGPERPLLWGVPDVRPVRRPPRRRLTATRRFRSPPDAYGSTGWVRSRQVAVWLLLPLVTMAMLSTDRMRIPSSPYAGAVDAGGIPWGAMGLVLIPVLVILVPISLDPEDMHDIAWRPAAQSVHALICLTVYLSAQPQLLGADPTWWSSLCCLSSGFLLLCTQLGLALRARD
ncbi:hypothetical protein ACIRPK_21140 [Kitasatospora sp. NPDC101801]|uniref:hypothetical protein n=1 Tax=Kitasatospora sp. NPDC101801 TaxID=3364103 RepID=UPI003815E031